MHEGSWMSLHPGPNLMELSVIWSVLQKMLDFMRNVVIERYGKRTSMWLVKILSSRCMGWRGRAESKLRRNTCRLMYSELQQSLARSTSTCDSFSVSISSHPCIPPDDHLLNDRFREGGPFNSLFPAHQNAQPQFFLSQTTPSLKHREQPFQR